MKNKIIELFEKIKKTLAPYKKNIIFPALKILGIIILCAILARLMNGNMTLSEYASKNPEIAYGTSINP